MYESHSLVSVWIKHIWDLHTLPPLSSAHWAALSICVSTHSTQACTCVSVCMSLLLFFFFCIFFSTVNACMCKAFQLSTIHVSSYLPFSEMVAVKTCIEHQIQQLRFSAGYSISHQGSGLGSISWHFQCRALRLEMKKQPRTLLLSEKQRDTTKALELHCCFGFRCVRACVYVCAFVCFGSCRAECGKFRCTC